MVRRLLYWNILLILSLVLGACGSNNMNLSENIMAPDNRLLPISGKWVIEDYKLGSISDLDEDMAKHYIGEEALFHKELVTLGPDICWEPSYKLKTTKAMDYLRHRYKVTPEYLDIDQNEIQVISVESDGQLFNEYIKLSEDRAIIGMGGAFFLMKRVNEYIEPEIIAEYYDNREIKAETSDMEAEEEINSSILIGLKSLDLDNMEDDLVNWQYRTIFIRRDSKGIASIYETDEIFLPRRTGFAKVGVNRVKVKGRVNDRITVSDLNRKLDLRLEPRDREDRTLKSILYAGNDYISLEKTHYLGKGERTLELHMIDHLDKDRPLEIADILGEIGSEAFTEGANKAVETEHMGQMNSSVDLRPSEENFGLFRRNGHWIFRGRLDLVEDNKYSYKDFNINATPPKELVQYDELSISWNRIKIRVPGVLDAFISPDDDMLIALTHDAILIYLIEGGEISPIPESKIGLNSAERIIMSEWATGKYPLIWEEEILNHGVRPLK
ncbi:MAG: hypothetical protein GX329_03345 [Tissierellia bacterium]|nr:hypothetical protein [Tissierellia bacterium]